MSTTPIIGTAAESALARLTAAASKRPKSAPLSSTPLSLTTVSSTTVSSTPQRDPITDPITDPMAQKIRDGFVQAKEQADDLMKSARAERAAVAQGSLVEIDKALDDVLRMAAMLLAHGDGKGLDRLAKQVEGYLDQATDHVKAIDASEKDQPGIPGVTPDQRPAQRYTDSIEAKSRAISAMLRQAERDDAANRVEAALERFQEALPDLPKATPPEMGPEAENGAENGVEKEADAGISVVAETSTALANPTSSSLDALPSAAPVKATQADIEV